MADLTAKDVAARLSKAVSTVTLWCRQGRFPNARSEETLRGPVWIIPEKDLKGFNVPQVGRPKKKASKK